MQPDLKSMNRKELEKPKDIIDKALARIEKTEIKAALAAAEKAAKAHGFDLAQIIGAAAVGAPAKKRATKKPKNPGKPKYANPNDATQTWTGVMVLLISGRLLQKTEQNQFLVVLLFLGLYP